MIPDQQFTQPPARYTEATLIRAMEEKGIGRPSTYAPTISTITSHDYVIKEGKYLRPTPLGEVVTKLMKEHFADIVDLKFTNHMEAELDEIENGKAAWRDVLTDFYKDFSGEMSEAEKALDGVRIKVPDVLSDEYCDVCGRQMVVKKGKFGYFLACPGFPECTFTKPIVVEMPGKCPKCGGRILKRTSKKGLCVLRLRARHGLRLYNMGRPDEGLLPSLRQDDVQAQRQGTLKGFCENPECVNFVPEDQRGYKKKAAAPAEGAENADTAAAETAAEESVKPAAKKTAAKKTAAAKKPAAAKKTTAAKKDHRKENNKERY